MVRTRKLKIIVIILILLCMSVLPMAFSVSYAKWQIDKGNLGATVNVSSGGEVTSGDAFSDLPEEFNGGVLLKDANGKPVYPYSEYGESFVLWDYVPPYYDYTLYGAGDIAFSPENGEGKIYIQFFTKEKTPVTLPLGNRSGRMDWNTDKVVSDDVIHEDGSVWYVLPCNAYYYIGIGTVDGKEVIDIWYY